MEQAFEYDLCVIGGGPAGYAAAMRAIDFGKRVLLVEKDKVGGAGLYKGALASKTMWEFSQRVAEIRNVKSDYKVTYKEVMQVVNEALFERKTQMTAHLKLLQTEVSNQLLSHEHATAQIKDDHHVELLKSDGSIKIISCEFILVATGSTPRKLPNIQIDEKNIVTSDGIFDLEEFPKSLVILGAGVIGCEFATVFSNFGNTKVYLIDKADRILPFEDDDVSEMVTHNFEKNGVVIHKNASLLRMEIKDRGVEYELKHSDGSTEIIRVEKALVSVGRIPNVAGIGLENVGIQLNEKGGVLHDDTQTKVKNIYVAGDLTSDLALVNVAEREGRHAVARMFGLDVPPLQFNNVSTIMFLNPEVAAVGINVQEASKKKIPIRVVKIDYSCIARAIAMRKTNGFFKIIVSDDAYMKVLGMRAVGEHASSAIQAVALLIHMNKGVEELALMLHPHPSIIEGIQECMRMLLGKSIYKSSIFKDKLQCYRCVDNVCTPLESL